MEIIVTEKYGLANTIDQVIYIHPILNDFPEIKKKVIAHEREHQKAKGFWKNRQIDSFTEISFKDVWPVYKKKPSLLLKQYSPITLIDNTLYLEWSLIFLYFFYLIIASGVYLLSGLITETATERVLYFLGILTFSFIVYRIGKKLVNMVNKESKEKK